MRIVVIGGTGLIGSDVVARMREQGHDLVPASPSTGVNTVTGEGVKAALHGADVVLDASNSPSFADDDVMEFFRTSTTTLIEQAAAAGIKHYVALSIVGTDRLPESGYLRAKVAQENLITQSGLPYTVVRATQFFEFAAGIADSATQDGIVRLPAGGVQPIAATDVAAAVARAAADDPVGGIVEIGGPQSFTLDEWIRIALASFGDPREVVADPRARYFGAIPGPDDLRPAAGAELADTTLAAWLAARPRP